MIKNRFFLVQKMISFCALMGSSFFFFQKKFWSVFCFSRCYVCSLKFIFEKLLFLSSYQGKGQKNKIYILLIILKKLYFFYLYKWHGKKTTPIDKTKKNGKKNTQVFMWLGYKLMVEIHRRYHLWSCNGYIIPLIVYILFQCSPGVMLYISTTNLIN